MYYASSQILYGSINDPRRAPCRLSFIPGILYVFRLTCPLGTHFLKWVLWGGGQFEVEFTYTLFFAPQSVLRCRINNKPKVFDNTNIVRSDIANSYFAAATLAPCCLDWWHITSNACVAIEHFLGFFSLVLVVPCYVLDICGGDTTFEEWYLSVSQYLDLTHLSWSFAVGEGV